VRWLWQRRKQPRPTRDVQAEPRDSVMAFARAYLAATGARVRLQGDDLLSATAPGGETRRYTTSVAHAEAQSELLAPGGHTLAEMLDDTFARARISALRFVPAGDPVALARDAVAQPPPACGQCATAVPSDEAHERPGFAVCETCPLRSGRMVLAGAGQIQRMQVARQWEAAAIEVTFLTSGQDRGGRTEEWVRLALDAESARSVEPLRLAQIESAKHYTAPSDAANMIQAALDRARTALEPALDAAGLFLQQRAADVYRARVAEITATHERLRREQPDDARAIDHALKRELAALAEVYSVEIHASIESVCFITTPMAELRLRLLGGLDLPLTVDVGRGVLEPLTCGGCGTSTRSGSVCARGHVTCTSCQPGCPVCEGRIAPKRTPARPTAKPAAKKHPEALTVEHLDALTPELWRHCVSWLLAREGYTVESAPVESPAEGTSAGMVWRGTIGERRTVVQALRPPEGWLVGATEVRRAEALVAGEADTQVLLVAPSPAADEARQVAGECGVLLWDRDELRRKLAQLSSAPGHEAARAVREAHERAVAARKTRAALRKALDQASGGLAQTANAERVVGHAALIATTSALSAVCQSAGQAFVAWETLVADWLAAFAQRPSRAGALEIEADVARLHALRERGTHLGKATLQIFARLARTPAEGEMGYTAWRTALIEEYIARCVAYQSQIEMIDPSQWEDADRACSPAAQLRAEQVQREAKNATARTAKSYVQLNQLAGNR